MVSKKPAGATPPKTPKKLPSKVEVESSIKKATESKGWPNRPTIGWETSRGQVMCRTGRGGPGSSQKFAFKDSGSPKKAWQAAELFLPKAKKEYDAFHA